MAKPWKELALSDFIRENPDWEYDRPTAYVDFRGHEVFLTVSDQDEPTESDIPLFQAAFAGWEARLPQVAQRVEEHLQHFLPGRKVSPEEIAPFALKIYGDQGPTAVIFLFNVTGDYSDPDYALDEFDERSVLEYMYDVEEGKIDWDSLTTDMTNDFD